MNNNMSLCIPDPFTKRYTCPCCGYPGLPMPPYSEMKDPPYPKGLAPPYWKHFGELRPIILSFVDGLLPKIPVSEKGRKNVRDALSWDIMLICLEHEYRDVTEPFFYIPLLDPWYAAGHFPCGWDGDEFPDDWDGGTRFGQLMVF
jgi:hypothetical protein